MKTLDEVIKAFECCEEVECGKCPYKILFDDDSHVPCNQFDKDDDALHYLKEYREKQFELSEMFDQYQAAVAEEPNEPLDWGELKQMEGKPVWVECVLLDEPKAWYLIKRTREHMWVIDAQGDSHNLPKIAMGRVWQAYRKER